jgi:hypothetical protein
MSNGSALAIKAQTKAGPKGILALLMMTTASGHCYCSGVQFSILLHRVPALGACEGLSRQRTYIMGKDDLNKQELI